MLVHPGEGGEPTSFDYREAAPAAAWATMYTKNESQFTHRAVATPGTVRGMELAHRRFASLGWAELLQPAISLAKGGFILDSALARSANDTLAAAPDFQEFQRVYGKPGGGHWQAEDRMTLPDLADTLRILASEGPDTFYSARSRGAL